MRTLLFAAALALSAPAAAADPSSLPAGTYRLDASHASLIFRVDHLGFSRYTGRFGTFDATLELDPASPSAARLEARVDAASLGIENPPPGFRDELLSAVWLDAIGHPQIVFHSTAVEPTGPTTARVTGDLSFRGATQPVTLDVTFNGGYAGHPMDPNARIGFSARGTLARSAFGMTAGIPAPGSTMGVGDAVELIVEAEFTGPPLATPAQP